MQAKEPRSRHRSQAQATASTDSASVATALVPGWSLAASGQCYFFLPLDAIKPKTPPRCSKNLCSLVPSLFLYRNYWANSSSSIPTSPTLSPPANSVPIHIMSAPEGLPKMEYRFLGRSGLKVSAISLGGWLTYGGHVDRGTSPS